MCRSASPCNRVSFRGVKYVHKSLPHIWQRAILSNASFTDFTGTPQQRSVHTAHSEYGKSFKYSSTQKSILKKKKIQLRVFTHSNHSNFGTEFSKELLIEAKQFKWNVSTPANHVRFWNWQIWLKFLCFSMNLNILQTPRKQFKSKLKMEYKMNNEHSIILDCQRNPKCSTV